LLVPCSLLSHIETATTAAPASTDKNYQQLPAFRKISLQKKKMMLPTLSSKQDEEKKPRCRGPFFIFFV
jgi:hypothetical protein